MRKVPIAKQALRVLRNPAEYRHLGVAAANHIEQHHSNEVMLPRLLRYLERAANRHLAKVGAQ